MGPTLAPEMVLQWGRDVSVADVQLAAKDIEAKLRLQWGRYVSVADVMTWVSC